MREFKTFFKLEVGRFFHRKSLIGCFILFVLLMGLLHLNNLKYKQQLKDIEKFKLIEKQKIEQTKNTLQFGGIGFKGIIRATPESILYFNSGIFNELEMRINVADTLSIESELYGKSIFEDSPGHFTDFSGFLFLIGSFFGILYGYGSFRNIDYCKTLVSLSNRKTVFFMTALSRLIVLFLISIFYILSAGIYSLLFVPDFYINGFNSIFSFTGVFLITIIFFFSLGISFGAIKNSISGKTLLIITWGGILLLFPLLISKLINVKMHSFPSNMERNYKKWSCLMDFEHQAFKKMGKFTPEKARTIGGKIIYDIITNSIAPTFYQIETQNEQMMKDNINFYNFTSAFFPGSFYRSVTNGLSSKGYQNVFDFYYFAKKTKDAFIRWYFDRLYFCNTPNVVTFIEGEDIVYKAKSRVPDTFGLGMFIMFFYSALLIFFGYRRFDKYLKIPVIPIQKEKIPVPDENDLRDDNLEKPGISKDADFPFDKNKFLNGETSRKMHMEIHIEKGKYVMLETNRTHNDYLYSILSGVDVTIYKDRINTPIFFNNVQIDTNKPACDFMYLCSKEEIPADIRVIDFFNLMAYMLKLPKDKINRYSTEFGLGKTGKARFNDISELFKSRLLLIILKESPKEMNIVADQLTEVSEAGYISFQKALEESTGKNQSVLSLRSNTHCTAKSLSPEKNIINLTDVWNSLYKK